MKRNSLFLACCIGLMVFASCKKDPVKPTITLLQGGDYLTENAQVYLNESYTIGFTATGEKLTSVEATLTQNGTFLYTTALTIDEQPTYTDTFSIHMEATGTVTITCKVTDAAGQTASASMNVYCEEKPNAKFVGSFAGNALATGTMDVNLVGMEPIHQEITDREVPVIIELHEGLTVNEVVGTCTFEDRVIDCKGTVVDDVVTFEAINDVMLFPYDLGGFTVSPELHLTYNIKGVLNGDKLTLDGTGTGNGDINLFIYNGTVDVDITAVGGELDRQ